MFGDHSVIGEIHLWRGQHCVAVGAQNILELEPLRCLRPPKPDAAHCTRHHVVFHAFERIGQFYPYDRGVSAC